MSILKRYGEWRKKMEWKKKYPDPLIVCDVLDCPHVDGYLCNPHACIDLKESKEKDGNKNDR